MIDVAASRNVRAARRGTMETSDRRRRAPRGSPSCRRPRRHRGTAGRPVLVHGPTERTGTLMALIACPKCNSEDINGTPAGRQPPADPLRGLRPRVAARRGPPRPGPARGADDRLAARRLPEAPPTSAPTSASGWRCSMSEFRVNRREPDPEVAEYRARYQELFSREGLPTRAPRGPAAVRHHRHDREPRQHVRPQPGVEDPGRRQGGAEGPRVDRVPALRAREPAPGGPAHPADRGQEGSASRRSTRSRCSPRCSASSSPTGSCRS